MHWIKAIRKHIESRFYSSKGNVDEAIINSYNEGLSNMIVRHYKILLPFFLFIMSVYVYTDIYVRLRPQLVLVRLPAFAFGVLLLLVANTTLRQRKSLVLFVNNLFA